MALLACPPVFSRIWAESALAGKLPVAPKRTAGDRRIEATDRQIDRLVYELYGLTDEEIAIVEESPAPPGI